MNYPLRKQLSIIILVFQQSLPQVNFSSTWSYFHAHFTPLPFLKLKSEGTFSSIQISTPGPAGEPTCNLEKKLWPWCESLQSWSSRCSRGQVFLRTQFSVLHCSFKQERSACPVFRIHTMHLDTPCFPKQRPWYVPSPEEHVQGLYKEEVAPPQLIAQKWKTTGKGGWRNAKHAQFSKV